MCSCHLRHSNMLGMCSASCLDVFANALRLCLCEARQQLWLQRCHETVDIMFGAPCSEADLKESRFSTPPLRYLHGALHPVFIKRPGAPQEAYPGAQHRLGQVSPTFPPSEQHTE